MASAGALRNSATKLENMARTGMDPVIEIGFIKPNQFLDRTGRKFWGADYHNFTEALGEALEKATKGFVRPIRSGTPKRTGALGKSTFSIISRGGSEVVASSGTKLKLVARRGSSRGNVANLPSYLKGSLFRDGIHIEAGYQAYKRTIPGYQQMKAIEYGNRRTKKSGAVRGTRQHMINQVRLRVRANINKYLGHIRRAPTAELQDPRRPLTEKGFARIRNENRKIQDNVQRYAATKGQFRGSNSTITKRFPSEKIAGRSS